MTSEIAKFKVGDPVEKYAGDYQARGVVRAAFLIETQDGGTALRYVVQFDAIPLCHILSEKQIRLAPP